MTDDPTIEQRWYWDRRTNKAYYPTHIDEEEGTVDLVTTWHHDEVLDALDANALTPVEDLPDQYDLDVGFACFDSFRFDAVDADPDMEASADD
jgi:hypothetical protein